MGVHVVIRKSGANVQAKEAVSHLPLNVEEAMTGSFGEARDEGNTAE
jgi:hypothetical protein